MASIPGGEVQGISLSAFLQMIQMEKTTCTLSIRSGRKGGTLYLYDGELVDAEFGKFSPAEAAYEILALSDPLIQMNHGCERTTNRIQTAMMSILMEGMRRMDERTAAGELLTVADEEEEFEGSDDLDALSSYEFSSIEVNQTTGVDFTDRILLDPPAPASSRNASSAPVKPVLTAIEQETAPSPPKRKTWPVALLAMVLLICAGCAVYLGYSKYRHDVAYADLSAALTELPLPEQKEAVLDNFLKAFPGSDHAPKLTRTLQELRRTIIARDYKDLLLQVENRPRDLTGLDSSLRLYDRFLVRHPEGREATDIRQRREDRLNLARTSLMATVTDTQNQEADRLGAAKEIIKRFSASEEAGHARTYIEMVSRHHFESIQNLSCKTAAELAACMAACDDFLLHFADLPIAGEIQTKKDTLLPRYRIAKIAEGARASGKTAQEQLRHYRNARNGETIPAVLDAIDQKINALQLAADNDRAWDRIRSQLGRPGLSEATRIAILNQYLADTPPEPYRSKAERLRSGILQTRAERARKEAETTARIAAATARKKAAEKASKERAAQTRMRTAQRRVQALLPATGGRFTDNGNGTLTDTRTGMTWAMMDSEAQTGTCLDYAAAKQFAASLRLGGKSGWRLPTEGELATLFKNPPAYPAPYPDRWYWTSDMFIRGYRDEARVVTAKAESVWKKQSRPLTDCGHVLAVHP